MHYLDPVTYSKKILALMEDEMPAVEETIPVKGAMTIKERISPKSNRLYILDNGLRYHSSSNPINYSQRYSINFNFN